MRVHLPLIHNDSTTHMHGLLVYVKEGLSFAWDLSLQNSADSYLCFRLAFFNCYLAAPWLTLGHYRRHSLTYPMLITAFYIFDPRVTGNLLGEVGSLSPAERLVGFEPGTFRFWLQHLHPLGHSPRINSLSVLLLFPLSITFLNFMHGFWFSFI